MLRIHLHNALPPTGGIGEHMLLLVLCGSSTFVLHEAQL